MTQITTPAAPALETLKAALEAKGCQTHIDEDLFGFCLQNKATWTWFSVRKIGDETIYLFRQRYSQLTGRTKKGFSSRMAASNTILRLTGFDI